jgi:hypothetical protein
LIARRTLYSESSPEFVALRALALELIAHAFGPDVLPAYRRG